jgi:26S proteasome regulatory subunit T4
VFLFNFPASLSLLFPFFQDPGKVSWGDVGGLNDQIRELREVIELPLTNPELFVRVGIKPPKGT